MSRIGRLPISLPAGVTVNVDKNNLVSVTGKLGSLTQQINKLITVKVENDVVTLTRANELQQTKALHGLYRALIANMVKGVSEGYSKKLTIAGVGYKAAKSGNKLVLNLGLSHQVFIEEVEGIELLCPTATEIVVKGINKDLVGQVAANIRSKRPVEPYHLYGIRYSDEVLVKKVGKTSGKK